jgi:hypothetical protein
MNTVEIKQVSNGFYVTVHVHSENYDSKEYVFAKEYQVIKFLKELFKSEE